MLGHERVLRLHGVEGRLSAAVCSAVTIAWFNFSCSGKCRLISCVASALCVSVAIMPSVSLPLHNCDDFKVSPSNGTVPMSMLCCS